MVATAVIYFPRSSPNRREVKLSMTNLRNCFFFIAILSTPAFCWQNTPEAALEEMATADKLEVMVKHLPVKVQEAIEKLDEKEKKEISEKLLVKSHIERDGGRFTKSEDGRSWEIRNGKGEVEAAIKLVDSFISGTEALLSLQLVDHPAAQDNKESGSHVDPTPRRGRDNQFILVSMRLEEGEWRVIGLGPWEHKNLEADDFLQGFLPDKQAGDATAAASTLRTLNTALVTYATTYPQTGLPASLQQLSGASGSEPSSQHAMLMDPAFATVPLIRDGYEFRYTLIEPGAINPETDKEPQEPQGRYTITATPVEFGKTGSKSFFTDQSCVVRFTTENRAANENDEPL